MRNMFQCPTVLHPAVKLEMDQRVSRFCISLEILQLRDLLLPFFQCQYYEEFLVESYNNLIKSYSNLQQLWNGMSQDIMRNLCPNA
ncbi:hypothetical protein CDAR_103421 [Caerostris darwini]|uniref:Uncharacterized protein n=1 Tax=Caerostris darwini TaxID=1538125 RepID=A0AAV4W9C0_9ARAC|nr:hypothetical protein CDAR_103421 [Caerostris darwini]